MPAKVYYNTKGINCSPTSSFLYTRIEDVDCSGASFEKPPVDGQFVSAPGSTAHSGWNAAGHAATTADYSDANVGSLDLLRGPALAMVWLSQFKTDQDALGSAKVPVVRGSLRVKTKYFHSPAGDLTVDCLPGAPLTVAAVDHAAVASALVAGSSQRLVLTPAVTALGAVESGSTKSSWVVGYVVQIVSSTAGSEEIEVQLYEFPRLVTEAKD